MKPLALSALLLAAIAAASEPPATEPPAEAEADAPAASEAAEETMPPRARYNLGLEQLAAEDYPAAAEAFLAARDDAGPDPLLRYRAAFNLGYALAQGVDGETPPAEAIETLRQSAAWFNDAVRLAPPDEEDARVNLELVSRRILQLADQLNAGDKLQARLDRLIDDQRSLRDQVRGLLTDVAAAEATTEPIGFKSEFDGLASRERTLAAEVGDCLDLAAEERLYIEQLPEAERTPEQQGRAYQLQGVADQLERARQSLSDARRRLRRLDGERAHRRADAALAELKRAREHLMDPLQVLQAARRDELELMAHTAAKVSFDAGDTGEAGDETPPPWLTARHLRERQESIGTRTGGVLGQFDAVTAQAANGPAEGGPEQARLAAAIAEATPPLEEALAAMRTAIGALEAEDAAAALPAQEFATSALGQAIELFADAKGLIELAYATQQNIKALLAPAEADEGSTSAERTAAARAQTTTNQARVARLERLLQEEAAAQGGDAAVEQWADEPAEDAAARQAAEARQQQAEALRVRAAAGLDALASQLEAVGPDGTPPAPARATADETLAALDALRRLYFSIVEHLQALRQEQADTHDQTATLQFETSTDASEATVAQFGPVAERQAQHESFGDALADALAQQADSANAADAQTSAGDGQNAGDDSEASPGERFAEAAAEVHQASGRMAAAKAVLAEVAARAGAMSPELEPALADQQAALDHLDSALAALAPPQGQQNQQGQGQSGGGEQAEQQPAEDPVSQRQALRRLQAIRDREAQRARQRAGANEQTPVEKDW